MRVRKTMIAAKTSFLSIALLHLLIWSQESQGQFYETDPNQAFHYPNVNRESLFRRSGQNVTLECQGISEASLVRSLQWLCRGCHSRSASAESEVVSVEIGGKVTVNDPTDREARLSLSPKFGLILNPLVAGDSGAYACMVNNRKRPNAIVSLKVQDVPDRPGMPLIMAFTSRSVNLSWTPPLNVHHSPVDRYVIEVRVGEDGAWTGNTALETPHNSTIFQVTDLQPFTTYSFRVFAVNSIGKSEPSKESYYMLTLREVPSGKPTITAAHNTSSTSILLSWRPPHPSTIHGEFLGYRIAFKPRNASNSELREILIKDPTVEKYIIQRLDIFTQYLVSLQVFNPEGLGPSTTVVVMTDEGVPSQPMNVTFGDVTNSSVTLEWSKPDQPNGIIQGYRLYYMYKNFTDVQTVRQPEHHIQFKLEGLVPYTKYKLWLKAFTWKNEGQSSDPIELTTDVSGPSRPLVSNLTCQDENSLFIEWERPSTVYKTVDYYFVYVRSEDKWVFEEVVLARNGSQEVDTEILLPNLTANAMHEVKVRGATRSIYNHSIIYKGDFSESHRILLQKNCDQIKASTIVRTDAISLELSAGMIAGGACVAFAVLLAVLALALWRKYFNESYYYLDESIGTATPAPSIVPDWDLEPETGGSASSSVSTSSSDGTGSLISGTKRVRTAIPAHLFVSRVAGMHEDDDAGFHKEYEAIKRHEDEYAANMAISDDNKSKNRYNNVVAYDHSRVQLRPLPGQKRGDYVNANYIDGFQKGRAYIATQGPMPSTFDSFWRMIWEQKVRVIVMITNLVEGGRRKCDLYWPTEGAQTHGLIEVTLISEDVLATYTIRTFKIRHTKIKATAKASKAKLGERYVQQFHYTNWPDHGVPENPLPVLSFVKKSSAANRETDGPIVVHCSAGVGRTGAYILVDAMLKQMRAKGELNLVAYLKHIRTQRNFLVQTEEQYIFVHDALAEAVASGETNINRSYLSRYINSLQSSFTTDEKSIPWQLLDRQFKLATAYQPQEAQFMAALKPTNQAKNQNFDFLPIESARVSLLPRAGVEGSDYINASWLPGYNQLREFIITQHPTEQTVADFWQMIWDHNVRIAVVLSALQQPEFAIFWPTKHSDIEMASMRVKLLQESDCGGYQSKDFTLISLKEDYELIVRLIFCPSWPHHCSHLASVTDLIKVVRSVKLKQQIGPLVVVDRFGGTEAATFCALYTLLKQLDFENHVDVYQYAKVAHNRRPGIWKSQDDYLYLYRVCESMCQGLEKRSNQSKHTNSETYSPKRFMTMITPYPNGHVSPVMNGSGHNHVCVRIPPDGMESQSNESIRI